MRTLIIEDEKPASEKLKKSLQKTGADISIEAILGSVKEVVNWLKLHPSPELVFMDIELADGLSFKIFDEAKINCPIIFTTAYDEYWQEAFEYNSIDYLLKPIKQEKLNAALKKYEQLKQHFTGNFQQLLQWQQQSTQNYKKRFLVKKGTDYITIKTEDIAYFYATYKLVCLVEKTGQKFILDKSLSDLEKELEPALFYRVNRKYLVNINSIKKIKSYPKSKLQIELEPSVNEDVIVSQENTAAFKEWAG
ncbi:MAG: LytTR family DNA-binding domain-containing protein [Chitinophagaceae bacterium]